MYLSVSAHAIVINGTTYMLSLLSDIGNLGIPPDGFTNIIIVQNILCMENLYIIKLYWRNSFDVLK